MSRPNLPRCGAPAAVRIEAYSPANGCAHGSLDLTVSTCAEHLEDAVSVLTAAGFTPHRYPHRAARCGDGFDYTGTHAEPLI